MEKFIQFYKNLKPMHLFLFGTVFLLLARTTKDNLGFEMGSLLASLFMYILALTKYLKKEKK